MPVTPPETVKTPAVLLLLVRVVPPLFTVRALVVMLSGSLPLLVVMAVTLEPTPPVIELATVPVPVPMPLLPAAAVEGGIGERDRPNVIHRVGGEVD